jgi:hypothetical protein
VRIVKRHVVYVGAFGQSSGTPFKHLLLEIHDAVVETHKVGLLSSFSKRTVVEQLLALRHYIFLLGRFTGLSYIWTHLLTLSYTGSYRLHVVPDNKVSAASGTSCCGIVYEDCLKWRSGESCRVDLRPAIAWYLYQILDFTLTQIYSSLYI